MIDNSAILKQMPPVQNKTVLNKANAFNSDIIKTIHDNFPEAVKQTKAIAPSLRGKDARQTAIKIWLFLKQRIKYKKDTQANQNIKLPNRFLFDGSGDCKSYSLFANAVLYNLGYPAYFRYASYDRTSPIPSHVYSFTKDAKDNDVIVDGVWNKHCAEKKYSSKIDYPMNVNTLSGVNNVSYRRIQGIGAKGKLKAVVKKVAAKATSTASKVAPKATAAVVKKIAPKSKAAAAATTTAKKAADKKTAKKVAKLVSKKEGTKKLKTVLKKVGKGAKKISFATSRGALLALVKINVHGLATKLAATVSKDPTNLKKTWEKFGGNFDTFKNAIAEGAKRKKILGIECCFGNDSISYIANPPIGLVASTATTALIISAAPIIVALTALFKKNKLSDKDSDNLTKDAMDGYQQETGESAVDAAKEAVEASGNPNTASLIEAGGSIVDSFKGLFNKKKKGGASAEASNDESSSTTSSMDESGATETTRPGAEKVAEGGFGLGKILLIGGGIAALRLLTNKGKLF